MRRSILNRRSGFIEWNFAVVADKLIQTETQHWVPKFLLKHFRDGDGRIYRYDISDGTVSKPPPVHAASKPNFNELLVDGEPLSFEKVFEDIETAAAPPIKLIVENLSLSNIDAKYRRKIAKFIAAQSFRTEAYRIGLDRSGQRIGIGDALAMLLRDLEVWTDIVYNRYWALMVTNDENSFYLGDNPVVLQSTEHPSEARELGLDIDGVEAFLPLSPCCALYMPSLSTGKEIVSGVWDALTLTVCSLSRKIELQRQEYEVSRKALKSGMPLYRAFLYGEPLAANMENVENLNALQCRWASSAIYSHRSKFSFAQKVFCESPDYRGVISVKLTRLC